MARLFDRLTGASRARTHAPADADHEAIRASGLFDPAYYTSQCHAGLRDLDPIAHYLAEGAAADLDPHPLFRTGGYRARAAGGLGGSNPLLHFLRAADEEAVDPHPLVSLAHLERADPQADARPAARLAAFANHTGPATPAPNALFDPVWYLQRYPEVRAARCNPLIHYVVAGESLGYRPNPLFDPRWYAARHPELAVFGGALLAHYLSQGAATDEAPGPLFAAAWYRAHWPGGLPEGVGALEHYLTVGARSGADPHPLFSGAFYLRNVPPLARDGIDPVAHFLDAGARAGLPPHPLFDTAWYLERNPDLAGPVARGELNPLEHFLDWGAAEGRSPHPLFDLPWYRARHPASARGGRNSLLHYLEEGAGRELPPNPFFDPTWYRTRHPELGAPGLETFLHLAARRGEPGYEPNPRFRDYAPFFAPHAAFPELSDPTQNPLLRIRDERDAAPMDPLAMPAVDVPEASIVIPVYEQVAHTVACLRSIAAARTRTPIEVIVVDDASPAVDYRERLKDVPNLRVIRNERNQGFVGTCNHGAEVARGRVLVFLNNDTIVTDDWLDELVDTFEKVPDAGAVGSKLLFPSGRTAEAGCIVWRDGSAWNFGRRHPTDSPEVGYLRPADYVSAAALAIERDFFAALGGFDPAFAPAYYEDTDLAMRVRREGRRVLYQPTSVVFHFEGVSFGNDPESGIKAHQVAHREIFRTRWHDEICGHRESGVEPDLEKDRAYRGRALVVDTSTPVPRRDSRSQRALHTMRALLELGFHVSFLPANGRAPEPERSTLQSYGIRVLPRPWAVGVERFLADSGERFDVVLVCRPVLARRHLEALRRRLPEARLLYDTVDLLSPDALSALVTPGDAAPDHPTAAPAAHADATLVAATPGTLVELAGGPPRAGVDALPWIYAPPRERRGHAGRRDLLLIPALQGAASVDAALWLLEAILPRLADSQPGVRVLLPAQPELRGLAALDRRLCIQSDRALEAVGALDRPRVAIAPARFGPALAGRLQPALARGLPCVATPHAVSGMPASLCQVIALAKRAEDFAAAVLRLYQDADAWESASRASAEAIQAIYAHDTAREQLRRILANAGQPRGEETERG